MLPPLADRDGDGALSSNGVERAFMYLLGGIVILGGLMLAVVGLSSIQERAPQSPRSRLELPQLNNPQPLEAPQQPQPTDLDGGVS